MTALLNNRPRVAQAALAVAIIAMALPWAATVVAGTAPGEQAALRGFQMGPGQLVIAVGLASIAAIELGWRPAWMGAGLIVAILVREFIDLSDSKTVVSNDAIATYADAGTAIWVGIAAAVSALIILTWHMFSEVADSAGQHSGEVDA